VVTLVTSYKETNRLTSISHLVLQTEQVIQHSQSTRKALGGSLQDHFKFLLVLGPTELDREIKSRFEAWDSDKSGSLGREEMRSAMEEMGKKPTEAELDAFLKEVDLDGNGTIGM
jgi:Ca2+-binding EF-hand superfamily protein